LKRKFAAWRHFDAAADRMILNVGWPPTPFNGRYTSQTDKREGFKRRSTCRQALVILSTLELKYGSVLDGVAVLARRPMRAVTQIPGLTPDRHGL